MLHTIIEEGLTDQQYIAGYTEGFEELQSAIKDFPPEAMAAVCGIPAETMREVARLYATRARLDHLLGHGHQPARPRHRQRPLPDRAGADHRPDRPARHRPASAARPEQRAGRVGCRADPDGLSRTTSRSRPGRCARCSRRLWGTELDPETRADRRRDHERDPCRQDPRHVHQGENPAMSDPDLNHAREALAKLEHSWCRISS